VSAVFRVGVFAVATIVAAFAVWAVLGNFSLRHNSYQIAVHFRNVVGLQVGNPIQLAGVDIGVVDQINLLPDQTATVICSIKSDNTIYRGSAFTVTSTLTGQSTLGIFPPANLAAAVPLPRRVLPEGEQPEGIVPPTIADLVSEGQKRLKDLDKTLAIVNAELPGMVHHFNDVATNTNSLIVHADSQFNTIGKQLNTTVNGVNALVASLDTMLAQNGRNISEMTTTVRRLFETKGPQISRLIDNLASTSENLKKTMVTVSAIATDPRTKENLLEAVANLKESSEKLKAVTTDIQNVTGDPRVQSELKGAVHNLNDAIGKADDILGTFSTAQGQATGPPAPATSPGPAHGVPPASPGPTHQGGGRVGRAFAGFELASTHVRESWTTLSSGPSSDLNLELLPRWPTHLTLGANDLGYNTTYNFLIDLRQSPRLQTSFGVLYSNLGVQTQYRAAGPFGFDARLYDPKRPRLDLYGDLRLTQRLQFFYGERSLMGPSSTRAPLGGLQFNL
jgi:phospholipid/cholesterol/gamma-HCH transport system substrate-binding protein